MTTEADLIEMGRRWRESNPDLVRQLLAPQRPIGQPGVGKHGPMLNIPNNPRRREGWERWEDDLIMAVPSLSLDDLAARTGRSKPAIHSRRYVLQQGVSPARYHGPCWAPDQCQMRNGRCRQFCEPKAAQETRCVS